MYHNQCFRAKNINIIIFHLKINIYSREILHGRVCVMRRNLFEDNTSV